MRLTQQQIDAFITVFSAFKFTGELRLHGSRVNDAAKGGDIDLLLLVATEAELNKLKSEKLKILVGIKEKIGDQKIDLVLSTYEKAKDDAFIQTILPASQIIHEFSR